MYFLNSDDGYDGVFGPVWVGALLVFVALLQFVGRIDFVGKIVELGFLMGL